MFKSFGSYKVNTDNVTYVSHLTTPEGVPRTVVRFVNGPDIVFEGAEALDVFEESVFDLADNAAPLPSDFVTTGNTTFRLSDVRGFRLFPRDDRGAEYRLYVDLVYTKMPHEIQGPEAVRAADFLNSRLAAAAL